MQTMMTVSKSQQPVSKSQQHVSMSQQYVSKSQQHHHHEYSLADWPIFPQSDYRQSSSLSEESTTGLSSSSNVLRLPPGSQNFDSWVNNEVAEFISYGMQYYVGAVVLAHHHSQPRLLLLSVNDGDKDKHGNLQESSENIKLHKQESSENRGSSSPDDLLIKHYSLPLFAYQKWQNPGDVLADQMSKMFQCKGGHSADNLSDIFGTSGGAATPTQEVAPTQESAAGSVADGDGISKHPNDDVDMQNNPSQVDVPSFTSSATNLENRSTGITTTNQEVDDLYADLLVLPQHKPTTGQEVTSMDTPGSRQATATTTSQHFQRSPSLHQYQPFIGPLLGIWWILEFGHPPVPFLPLHISRPKVQVRLYQVVVPPECTVLLPPVMNAQFKFVPFDTLISSSLGPAYESLPLLVSRFSLCPFVARPVDRSTALTNTLTRQSSGGKQVH